MRREHSVPPPSRHPVLGIEITASSTLAAALLIQCEPFAGGIEFILRHLPGGTVNLFPRCII